MSEQLAPVERTPVEAAPVVVPTPTASPVADADLSAAYSDRVAFEQYRDANPFVRAAMYDRNQDAIERGRKNSQSPVAPPATTRRNYFREARERLENESK